MKFIKLVEWYFHKFSYEMATYVRFSIHNHGNQPYRLHYRSRLRSLGAATSYWTSPTPTAIQGIVTLATTATEDVDVTSTTASTQYVISVTKCKHFYYRGRLRSPRAATSRGTSPTPAAIQGIATLATTTTGNVDVAATTTAQYVTAGTTEGADHHNETTRTAVGWWDFYFFIDFV